MKLKRASWAHLSLSNVLDRRRTAPQQNSQPNSKLLSLPNELLIHIIMQCMSFIFDTSGPENIHHSSSWTSLALTCQRAYRLTLLLWPHHTFDVPATIDLAKWTFRRLNPHGPRPHERLTLYLQLPTFLKLPGEIRMPPTNHIHRLSLNWEAAWVVASHNNDRFRAMPEMKLLKTITMGPFAYTSPWTMSVLHLEQLEAYRSSALSCGGWKRGVDLWTRWLAKCPRLEGMAAVRAWDAEGEVGRPGSKKLAEEVRAQTMEDVQRKIVLLDSVLSLLVGNLVARRMEMAEGERRWADVVAEEAKRVQVEHLSALTRWE